MKTYTTLFYILLTFFIVLFLSCKTKETGSTLEIDKVHLSETKNIDIAIDSFVEKGIFPFLYVRLENLDGSLIYEHSKVNRELIPELTIDKDTWIRIWSMSKIITIAIALDLVEDGLLKLEDPVTNYIPEFKNLKVALDKDGQQLSSLNGDEFQQACDFQLVPPDSVMTLLHLINHQAGFYYATTGNKCLDDGLASLNLPSSKSSKEFIEKITKAPLIQHPGTNDFYGINTTILGFVAERATGKSLKQLVEERVTQPLKIKGLQYALSKENLLPPKISGKDSILRMAHSGELDIFGPTFPIYDPANPLYLGGEGMVGTADGYLDFVRMLVAHGKLNNHRFLNKETVEDIYAPHTQLENPYGYNGFNLWVASDTILTFESGEPGIWLGGGYEGTHYWADPKRKFVGIIMTQIFESRDPGHGKDNEIRKAIYQQIWSQEKEALK